MKVLLINTHLPYPNWSEGTLNASAQAVAREFFTERGDEVLATGYTVHACVDAKTRKPIRVPDYLLNFAIMPAS